MVCSSPIQIKYGKELEECRLLPCGHCVPCRIQRTSQWQLRLMAELPYWDYKASFITLTYDDEHLPSDNGLHKEELQKFWKRLRKDLGYKIRYYACGEYGDKEKIYMSPGATIAHGRPHYHAIVFGFDYNKKENRQIIKDNWRLCDPTRFDYNYYKKQEQGFAPVSADDIRYVCGYIQKKYNSELGLAVYGDSLPPFQICSQGLGLQYAIDNKEAIADRGIWFYGKKQPVPRYFVKKLELDPKSMNGDILQSKIEFLCSKGLGNFVTNALVNARPDLIDHKYSVLARSALEQQEKILKHKLAYEME